LCNVFNVFTSTRKALDFKHSSQYQGTHKYMKEDEDIGYIWRY